MIGTLCVLAISYRYYAAPLSPPELWLWILLAGRPPINFLTVQITIRPVNGFFSDIISRRSPARDLLIGPVLAAQFGFLPGFLWLLIGVVLAGAVQDFVILFASTRREGKSLVEIARQEIGPAAGLTTAIAVLFIIIVALAGLGMAVVNALRDSAWGVFSIGASIPLALFMGWYMVRFRKGKTDGGYRHRRCRAPLPRSFLDAILAEPHSKNASTLSGDRRDVVYGGLWICRLRASCLAASGSP